MRKLKRTVIGLSCFCGFIQGCAGEQSTDPAASIPSLELIASHSLDLDEPSGLTLGMGGTVLWVVGNSPERIYELTVDGGRRKTLSYKGEDLEGIVFDPTDSTLWVVEEEQREVIQLDLTGNILRRKKLELTGAFNNGLEGISLDSAGTIYLLNEKMPGLFITLAPDMTIKDRLPIAFAQDYSGLAYDRGRDCFWILSHEDGALFLWNTEEGVLASFEMPYDKVEGVAIDEDAGRLYIVNELDHTLHVYSLNADG